MREVTSYFIKKARQMAAEENVTLHMMVCTLNAQFLEAFNLCLPEYSPTFGKVSMYGIQ